MVYIRAVALIRCSKQGKRCARLPTRPDTMVRPSVRRGSSALTRTDAHVCLHKIFPLGCARPLPGHPQADFHCRWATYQIRHPERP